MSAVQTIDTQPYSATQAPAAVPNPDTPSSKPKAIDLSHHLNLLARSRRSNALKGLYDYARKPGMIALAGGLPSEEYFPVSYSNRVALETAAMDPKLFKAKLVGPQNSKSEVYPCDKLSKVPPTAPTVDSDDATTVKPQSFFSWLFGKKPNQTISVPKARQSASPTDINLATLLQYSSAEGHPALQAFVREFTAKVYDPGYADWQVLVHVGATAGWNQVVNLLLERDDALLVEEWTYPGATGPYIPLNVKQVPMKMDGEGIIPADLENTLANWDEKKEGRRRPRLMYTVPTGQNPTGATMLAARKKEIYDICVKYDVIICEDEPYYFLYADPWIPKKGRKHHIDHMASLNRERGMEDFLKKLPPSYLKFDYQESSTQAPCGLGQAMITKLLTTWEYKGYIRWLRGIKATYAMRRDWMCDLFENVFHLEFNQKVAPFHESIQWVTAYPKTVPGSAGNSFLDEKRGHRNKALLSFVPPTAGMFVWLAIHLDNHPDYHSLKSRGLENPGEFLIDKLWRELAEHNVLVSPGAFFDGQGGQTHEGSENVGFFRLSFSIASHEQMETAVKTMYQVINDFFRE